MNLYDWCKERKDDTLLHEWDTEANGGLSPRYVGTGSGYKAFWSCPQGHLWQKPVLKRVAGSHKKMWWRCREHPDHEWQAAVYQRARKGQGCPYCTGNRSAS